MDSEKHLQSYDAAQAEMATAPHDRQSAENAMHQEAELAFLPLVEYATEIDRYTDMLFTASRRLSEAGEEQNEILQDLQEPLEAVQKILFRIGDLVRRRQGERSVALAKADKQASVEQVIAMLLHDINNALTGALANIDYVIGEIKGGATSSFDTGAVDDILYSLSVIRSALSDNLRYALQNSLKDSASPATLGTSLTNRLPDRPRESTVEPSLFVFQKKIAELAELNTSASLAQPGALVIQFDNKAGRMDGVHTSADSAVFNNLVLNLISNACSRDRVDKGELVRGIDAKEVNVSTFRDGSSLVVRVADKGVGLSAEQLNEAAEKFIFRTGVSDRGEGTRSTGFGLKNPEYLAAAGVTVNVVSRKRGEAEIPYSMYSNRIEDEREHITALERKAGENNFSTIFEVRIPYTTTN